MTKATFYRSEDGTLRGYTLSGHAEAIEDGEISLICCAVSTLALTGVNALEAVAHVRAHVREKDGYLRCILPEDLSGERAAKAETILKTVEVGIQCLAKDYPNTIKIKNELLTGGR